MPQFTEDNLQRNIINPFYTITVASQLIREHEPSMSEAEWVQANASLMKDFGAKEWLRQLLDVLSGDVVTAEEVGLAPPPGGGSPFGYQRYRGNSMQRRGKKKE